VKKIAVIGLGNFGMSVARELVENGAEVLGVDSSVDTTNVAKDIVSYAVCCDVTKKEVLDSLQIGDYDSVILAIGQDMTASILVALYLREIHARKIIARAISEDHAKILTKLGIDEVVYPERDTAIRLGNRLLLKNALDYLPVSGDYGIVEVIPPNSFIMKTLAELKITSRFNCQVIGIKTPDSEAEDLYHTKIAPTAGDIIRNNSILIVLGRLIDIQKLQKAD
jgi:trk system potassium uptake protein